MGYPEHKIRMQMKTQSAGYISMDLKWRLLYNKYKNLGY